LENDDAIAHANATVVNTAIETTMYFDTSTRWGDFSWYVGI